MSQHPYAPFLRRVERPGRYVGGEFGSCPPAGGARARIALAFPDAYEIGMSHIGLAVLYEIVNARPGLAAERVFMPWPDMEKELRARGLPLVALESARPLREFDAVGFSTSSRTPTSWRCSISAGSRAARRSGARACPS